MAEHEGGGRSAQEWYDRGYLLAMAGNYAEAVRAYSRAIELDVELARAYFGRAACHYVLGHYRWATEDLDAATLLGCADAQMWSRFERKHAEKGRDQEQEVSPAGCNNRDPDDS
jgi:tetratricopeptide (TPR) repeat protein